MNVQNNTVQNSETENKGPVKMSAEHTGTYQKERKEGEKVNLEKDRRLTVTRDCMEVNTE